VTISAVPYTPEDMDVMSRTLYGECRGEPHKGQIAVAWVIRNRLKRPKRFARTIAGICKQSFQFSCWNSGDPNRAKLDALPANDATLLKLRAVCIDVLGGFVEDPTDGAQFYYATSIPAPAWADGHEPSVVIGRHAFFNDVL